MRRDRSMKPAYFLPNVEPTLEQPSRERAPRTWSDNVLPSYHPFQESIGSFLSQNRLLEGQRSSWMAEKTTSRGTERQLEDSG